MEVVLLNFYRDRIGPELTERIIGWKCVYDGVDRHRAGAEAACVIFARRFPTGLTRSNSVSAICRVGRKNMFLARLYRDETCDRLRLFKTPVGRRPRARARVFSTVAISALNMRPGRDPRVMRGT